MLLISACVYIKRSAPDSLNVRHIESQDMTRPSPLRAVPLFSPQARGILTATPLRLNGHFPVVSEERDGTGE